MLTLNQGLFSGLCCVSEQVPKKIGGNMARKLNWTGQRDIPYYWMACSVYKLEGLGQEGLIAAWERVGYLSVCGEHLYCASFICLGLWFSLFVFLSLLLLIILYFNFISITKLFLSQPTGFTFSGVFGFSSPDHHGWGGVRQVNSSLVYSCQLALNHNSFKQAHFLLTQN